MMKTIEEIKNEVSVKNGFVDFIAVMFYHNCDGLTSEQLSDIITECMKEYAKQVAEVQREACIKSLTESDNPINDIEAIKNTQLVTDNI